MKTDRKQKNLMRLYSLAAAPFLEAEFEDSRKADLEFLRLLKQARKNGTQFADLSFFEDDCPLCVFEMKRAVYEELTPLFESAVSATVQ